MVHHVSLTPKNQKSGCLCDSNDFEKLLIQYQNEFNSIDDFNNNHIVLTFDDGLEDLYTIAYPLLRKYRIPFTVFIVTDFIDQPGYLTTSQIIEMSHDPICSIGSHGVTHLVFPKLSYAEKENELKRSKEILEKIIDKSVCYFAYSHGQYDHDTLKLVKKYYSKAFTAGGLGLNNFPLVRNKYLYQRLNFSNDSVVQTLNVLKSIKKG